MIPRFLHFWRSALASHAGRRIGIAVSAGKDSGVLATILAQFRRTLDIQPVVLIHLDHGLRTRRERQKDRAALSELSRRVRVPLVVRRAKIRAVGQGMESAGRTARLRIFRWATKAYRLDSVACGHHLDDRIETFFLFLLRGSGTRGLSSLRATEEVENVRIVRPLLLFRREEISDWGETARVPYHEDETNVDRKFMRNRIRHELIPMMASWHPGFAKAAAATMETLGREDEALSALAQDWFNKSRISVGSHSRFELNRDMLRSLPAGLVARILQMADRDASGSGLLSGHESLAAASKAVGSTDRFTIDLPARRRLVIDRSRIRILQKGER